MKRTLLAACFLSLASCMPTHGRLEVNRFQHETYPYAVFYTAEGDPLSPLGKAWRTANFEPDEQGGYRTKRGREHEIVRSYDTDADGSADTQEKGLLYDLLLQHAEKDATMWVSTTPIAPKERELPLSVFAERYVEAAAAAGEIPAGLPDLANTGRVASHILHTQPCEVSKREALQIDFELADTAQPGAGVQWRRGRVVMVRTGYEHRVQQVSTGQTTSAYPVLMTIGIGAKAADFATFEPDFDTLLQRTVLGDRHQGLSMNGQSSCGSLSAASTSGAEAPAPTAPAAEENEAAQIPLAPEALPQGENQASP